jgi:hypothetical protein
MAGGDSRPRRRGIQQFVRIRRQTTRTGPGRELAEFYAVELFYYDRPISVARDAGLCAEDISSGTTQKARQGLV